MPSKKDGRYEAYKLLRELDTQISATMNQIAYGHMSGIEWEEICKAHRIAFDEWMAFADGQVESERSDASEGLEIKRD
ncbi:hypothetical protein [Pseudomonas sp. PSKL.D1]|uniref:hypothetical protein n=1 Tax=Pseudomonas sp. PSKL.D1 TaxID=3029060 RepID=UPI002380CB22|nr:hypothetical protein [Pseudomonas sp. PSKL.D1]WDY57190.1 hypothetical protein PVV54_21835 [Pseudomonas sp. PSKL.D1]